MVSHEPEHFVLDLESKVLDLQNIEVHVLRSFSEFFINKSKFQVIFYFKVLICLEITVFRLPVTLLSFELRHPLVQLIEHGCHCALHAVLGVFQVAHKVLGCLSVQVNYSFQVLFVLQLYIGQNEFSVLAGRDKQRTQPFCHLLCQLVLVNQIHLVVARSCGLQVVVFVPGGASADRRQVDVVVVQVHAFLS